MPGKEFVPESPQGEPPKVPGPIKMIILPAVAAAGMIAAGHPELVGVSVIVTTVGEFAILLLKPHDRE
jgi:hypothetical protein